MNSSEENPGSKLFRNFIKSTNVKWELKNGKGEIVYQGDENLDILQGGIDKYGSINIDLLKFSKAEKLTLSIYLEGTTL
jgi:hypothetical protein